MMAHTTTIGQTIELRRVDPVATRALWRMGSSRPTTLARRTWKRCLTHRRWLECVAVSGEPVTQ